MKQLLDKTKVTCNEYNLPALEKYLEGLDKVLRQVVDDFVVGALPERAAINLEHELFDVQKPLMVSISTPLGYSDDPPTWRADMELEIISFIEDRIPYGDCDNEEAKLDEGDMVQCKAIRDALVRVTAIYDKVIARGIGGKNDGEKQERIHQA